MSGLLAVAGSTTTSVGGGVGLYAFSLGLVAAVNPCGFPLLPAYLTVSGSGTDELPLASRVLRALASGVAVTVGFVLVFGVLGAVTQVGLRLALGWLPWVMVPLGIACLAVGIMTVVGRGLRLRVPSRRLLAGRRRGVALFGFGVTYAVASLACAWPLFAGSVAGSFTTAGLAGGLVNGVAYALGMGLIICAVSLAGAGAQQLRLRRLRAAQPILQRLAGAVLAAVGGYLVFYWVSDAVAPTSSPGPEHLVERVQTALTSWLSASPRLTGLIVGLIVLAALGGASVSLLRGQTARPSPPARSTP